MTFTNYYYIIGISANATDEEISTALREHQGKRSLSLLDEVRMVLQNKELKAMYDAEYKLYESSESKQDYIISNPVLERELKKIGTYVSNKATESIATTEEPKKSSNTWLWILVFMVVSLFGKCMSSYNKGRQLEKNKLEFIKGEYNRTPENKDVADAMGTFRQELPFELEGIGKVREVDYEENAILFKMRIREDASSGLTVTKINQNQSLAKEIISAQIGMMSAQMKEAIKTFSEQSYILRVLVGGSQSGKDGIIELTPDDLSRALANTTTKSPDDFSLEMVALFTKLMLPARVDPVTTWIDTKVTDTTFECVCRIDDAGIDLNSIDIGMMKSEELSNLRQNMDVMGKIVESCIATHRSLTYMYIGSTTGTSIIVELKDSDLKNNR